MGFEITLQFLGITDIIVFFGFTGGKLSPGIFEGTDNTVLHLVLIVSVVLAFRVPSPGSSSFSSSLLVILGCLCRNFGVFLIDLSTVFVSRFVQFLPILIIDFLCLFSTIVIAPFNLFLDPSDRRHNSSHDRWRMQTPSIPLSVRLKHGFLPSTGVLIFRNLHTALPLANLPMANFLLDALFFKLEEPYSS